MTSYIIGRDPDKNQPHIVVRDKTVSRRHVAITHVEADRYLVEDIGSANGTYIRSENDWRRIEKETLALNDDLRLGTYVTNLGSLLAAVVPSAKRDRIERNPETGEIIKPNDRK